MLEIQIYFSIVSETVLSHAHFGLNPLELFGRGWWVGVGGELNLVLVAVHLVCMLLQTVTVERLSSTPSGEHRRLPSCGWERLRWTEAASCTR